MNRIISLILGLMCCLPVFPQTAILDSLNRELVKAQTPADSLIILYNIFDNTHADESNPILKAIYELGLREKNYVAINYALSLLSGFNSDSDSIQGLLIEQASKLPPYEINRNLLLYLKVRRSALAIKRMSEEEKQDKLLEYLADYRSRDWSNADIYEQTENLFKLVNFLRSATNGDMLTEYLIELDGIIKKITPPSMFLQGLYNNIASETFLENNMYEAAAQVNRDKLEFLKEFDKAEFMQNRPHKTYDGSLFTTYLALLMCQGVLTDEELDLYHDRLIQIEKARAGSRFSKSHMRRADIYYMMGKKQYARAIPLIKEQLQDINTNSERMRLLSLLIEASKAVDDKATLLESLDEHNKMLKQHIADKADASYKELQILYDVQNLKQINADLIHDNQVIAMERQRAITIATIIGLLCAVIIVIFLWRQYSRAHRLSKDLSSSNKILASERDNLKDTQRDLIEARDKAKAAERVKTDFVTSLSHEIRTPLNNIIEYANLISDSVTGDTAPYIKRFAEIVTRNSELLNTLANDILDGPSLENPGMTVRVVPTSAKEICQHALINMEKSLKPDVKLVFTNIDDSDVIINTDPHRAEQVIRNLLDNAIKFTRKGVVKLSYYTDIKRQSVIFAVTDTGIGIPAGKEEEIFERFDKLNPDTPGNGLGLYVARMLAQLLDGVLTLDTTYRNGARFLFEIPLSI